ncbi:MAG: tetratricopeptide repeat protein, partial [Bacteroidales bacterium]
MVKGFAIVGLVLMGTCLFGQSSKQYMKAAEQYIENGYYQEAVNQYTKALELDPQNGQAYEDRGKVLEHLGKLKEASGDFRSAAVFNINSAENYYHSAQLLNDLEDYKQALINIRHALSQKQKFQEAYILQCEIYLTVNDPANALKAAENAIDVKNTSYACYLRGKANVLLDHTQEAEQDFEKAIIKDKLHLDAYMALAELQLNTGKIRYAIENSSYIIKTDKENAHAYLIRSQCYDRLKDQEKSISDISKAIVLDSANIDYYIIRGKYYAGFAQYQNAINDFTIALDQDMTRVDALYGRAEAYEKIGNKPGSVSDYSLLLNFSADIEPDLAAAVKNKLFELNKESVKPRITLSDPVPNSNFQVPVPNDKDYIDLSAIVEDNSKIRFLKINNDTLLNDPEGKREKEFTTRIETDNLEFITVSATDIYDNSATVSYAIERIETHSPQIFLRNPYVGDDGTITVKPDDYYLYLDGQIEDESPISSIKIEDVNASYAPGDINPRFTATLDIRQKNRIKIIATDKYGNVNEQEYLFRLDGRILNENSPMGKTWVVLIENSDYKEFPNLKSPGRDILLMQQALNRYNINKVIVKRNLTKRELERFFAIDLRDLIRA